MARKGRTGSTPVSGTTLYGDRDFMPFGVAAVVALKYPLVGLGICISCLIVYLKPDPPGAVDRYCTDRPD